MDDIYQENIIDHYKNPRNFGELSGYTHKGRGANASCGDMVEMYVKIKSATSNRPSSTTKVATSERQGKEQVAIEDISFKGIGCALSTAVTSMLLEKIKAEKLTIDQVKSLKIKSVVELLGIEISPTRMKCVLLPLKVLHELLG